MKTEFYGAKVEAEIIVNQMLGLRASGQEQDWEFEFADASRIDAILGLSKSQNLGFDVKCALGLLLISSIEDARKNSNLMDEQIVEANNFFCSEHEVGSRMRFYWIELEKSDDRDFLLNKILC